MPSWLTPALKKLKKKRQKGAGLSVRFVDMGGDSTKNPLSSPPLGQSPGGPPSPGPGLRGQRRLRSDESLCEAGSTCSSDVHEPRDVRDVAGHEERDCLRHLDDLGAALENTFKEVESIDAYVSRLRSDFDHDRVTEHRYMTCLCSAKIARTACCKRQVETWRELQHGMQNLLCHYCPHHHHHHHLLPAPEENTCEDCDEEVSELLLHLRRMSTFDHVVQRLNPGGDQRSFVEQWVIQGSP